MRPFGRMRIMSPGAAHAGSVTGSDTTAAPSAAIVSAAAFFSSVSAPPPVFR